MIEYMTKRVNMPSCTSLKSEEDKFFHVQTVNSTFWRSYGYVHSVILFIGGRIASFH